jgi:hypothetical protein
MKLVRQIQATFYKDHGDELPLVTAPASAAAAVTTSASKDNDHSNPDKDGSMNSLSLLENVPLFRVQWTELCGYQNMLNIHEPHYTHMFRRILQGPKPWRFGHVYLPNGSKNLYNPDFRYDNPNTKACHVGTLMQISDVMDVVEDGRLGLIVQAIERFEITNVTQHEPYTMATVRLLPEEELASTATATSPLEELEKWHEWENYPTKYSECDAQRGYPQVTPLVNYNFNFFADEISIGINENDGDRENVIDDDIHRVLVLELEYKVWVALDTLLTTLGEVSGLRIPVPSQLLVLLPTHPSTPWPENFRIEKYAQQLQALNVDIGTYTKSPFLRVAENINYPSLRRTRRLSYAVWILLEAILGPSSPHRQSLLESTTIAERLTGAYEQLEEITRTLKAK